MIEATLETLASILRTHLDNEEFDVAYEAQV